MSNNQKPLAAKKSVPQELRDRIYRMMQVGDSFADMIKVLDDAGFPGYTRHSLEHFGQWREWPE